MSKRKLLLSWLKTRRAAVSYVAAVFGFFFFIYSLFDYEWGAAGYAALLGTVLGASLGARDFARYALRVKALERLTGRFPTGAMPEPLYSIESGYQEIIAALETERLRLEKDNENARRDAEEYYTLWAHQIKTPVAAAKLLLQSGRADAEALEQELFRIEQYVDMVLQYQRLSAIENDLALKRFDVLYLVKQAARNCAGLFIYKGLALETEGVTGSIVTDEKWFCFVLEQLYSNAVKYGGGKAVRVYSREPASLVIEDAGIGIPAEDLPRVFEMGFTGAAGRAERSSTGIGLYLCLRILARLGFVIAIESEAGKGTRAVLALKQDEAEADL